MYIRSQDKSVVLLADDAVIFLSFNKQIGVKKMKHCAGAIGFCLGQYASDERCEEVLREIHEFDGDSIYDMPKE